MSGRYEGIAPAAGTERVVSPSRHQEAKAVPPMVDPAAPAFLEYGLERR